MELGLVGKTVIITGGGSNIGRGIVHAFADEGCNIVIAELDPAQGQRVADEVAALGSTGRVMVVATDVTNHESVNAMVEAANDEFGGIDVLVNNAGWTIDRLFLEKPREEWEREVQVNLWGAINCIHAVLPGMVERKGGSIVCLSSDAGRMGEYREAVYSACKAGVIALSKSIARETGRHGLRLNCVCPGLVVPPDEETISQRDQYVAPDARSLHPRSPRARHPRLPPPPHGRGPRDRQRSGVSGVGRCGLHHGADVKRQRRVYDGLARGYARPP